MKNVTINTKKMVLVITALLSAGVNVGTLVTYFMDLVTGGPKHDWQNAIAVNIRNVVDAMIDDPLGWTLNIAVDVSLMYAAFKIVGFIISFFGGRKSIQIAKGVTWRFV